MPSSSLMVSTTLIEHLLVKQCHMLCYLIQSFQCSWFLFSLHIWEGGRVLLSPSCPSSYMARCTSRIRNAVWFLALSHSLLHKFKWAGSHHVLTKNEVNDFLSKTGRKAETHILIAAFSGCHGDNAKGEYRISGERQVIPQNYLSEAQKAKALLTVRGVQFFLSLLCSCDMVNQRHRGKAGCLGKSSSLVHPQSASVPAGGVSHGKDVCLFLNKYG